MITEKDLLSIGLIRRTRYKGLPDFVFVKRDGLFVPSAQSRSPNWWAKKDLCCAAMCRKKATES